MCILEYVLSGSPDAADPNAYGLMVICGASVPFATVEMHVLL